jgi:hypothetical protein
MAIPLVVGVMTYPIHSTGPSELPDEFSIVTRGCEFAPQRPAR